MSSYQWIIMESYGVDELHPIASCATLTETYDIVLRYIKNNVIKRPEFKCACPDLPADALLKLDGPIPVITLNEFESYYDNKVEHIMQVETISEENGYKICAKSHLHSVPIMWFYSYAFTAVACPIYENKQEQILCRCVPQSKDPYVVSCSKCKGYVTTDFDLRSTIDPWFNKH